MADSAKKGEDLWPPTYAAFIGHSQELTGGAAYKIFPKELPISDQIKKERQEIGIRECANILGMFDDDDK